MKQITSEGDLTELYRSTWSIAVLAAWAERGLLKKLAEASKPIAIDELPGDARSLRACVPVLAHLGILHTDGNAVALSPNARRMFERGELAIDRNLRWLGDLSRITDVLEHGGPVKDAAGNSRGTKGGVRTESIEETRGFMDYLYRRSEETAPVAVDWAMRRLKSDSRVIDVGGGHGRYSECFAKAGATVTLFDMELVAEIARERYGDLLQYRTGDYLDDTFGGPYDAAFLSNIVHGENDENVQDMLRRLHAAMAPGGWLILKDMFIDEQGCAPAQPVYFGMTMLFYTQGKSYQMSDVRRWCSEVGFGMPEVVTMDTHSLVFAQKPS